MRSFFQRESENIPSTPSAPPPKTAAPAPKKNRGEGRKTTHLARGSKVVGEISGRAELIVDGRVEGHIDLQNRVVIGDKGYVRGQIVAAAVEVSGKVHGNIRGLDKVEVLASGSLEGDVTSPRVVIADGAFFKGKIEMTDASVKPAPAASRPAAAAPQDGDPRKGAGPGSPGTPAPGLQKTPAPDPRTRDPQRAPQPLKKDGPSAGAKPGQPR